MNKLNFQLVKLKNKRKRLTISFFVYILFMGNLTFSQSINAYDLLITEIMSDPSPVVGLSEDEFIEIYNNSSTPINLSKTTIQIGSRLFIPDSFLLEPDSFNVFWDDNIPTLKNNGDSLKILHENKVIHRIDYTPSMHDSDFKRNGGWSIELIDFKKPCLINGNWNSSINSSGGSPGKPNDTEKELTAPQLELNSYCPKNDSQLSVVFTVPIESLETIYEYKLQYNKAIIDIPKLDSGSIDSILITYAGTCYEAPFQEINLKYGLPLNPDSGNIVINEILFNPDENGHDFIEVFNASDKPLDLSKLSFCKRNENNLLESPFKLSQSPFLLLPNEYCVVCPDKKWLSNTFPKAINIIESSIPSMNNDAGKVVLLTHSAKIIDEVNYIENWHYSELTNNENVSLEKLNPTSLNISSNWSSASSSENYASPGYENSNFIALETTTNYFEIANSIITPNADGYKDQLIIHYSLPNVHWTAKINVINYFGTTIHTIGGNMLLGKNGTIHWGGILQDKTIINPGIYALEIHAYNLKTQEKTQEKRTFYVNGTLK